MDATLYLSRLEVEALRLQHAAILADPYVLHQAIMAAFDPAERGDRRVLYRREPKPAPGYASERGVVFLVQSQTLPLWSRVAERFFGDALSAETKPVRCRLTEGQRLGFRLRANPTFRSLQGRRLALCDEAAQRHWLGQRLKAAGADLKGVEVIDEGWVHGDTTGLAFLTVCFEGLLEVRDPARLMGVVRQGIGSAKAFGCGLLSLRRAD